MQKDFAVKLFSLLQQVNSVIYSVGCSIWTLWISFCQWIR